MFKENELRNQMKQAETDVHCAVPSITDGVHRNENFVEIIPVFSNFSNFFKKKKIYIYM